MNTQDFINFQWTDALDILLVALLLFYVYRLIRGTVAIKIFLGIVVVWGLWKTTQILEIRMMSSIIGGFMNIGLIALVIVFQQEIRKFLLLIGSTNLGKRSGFLKPFNFLKSDAQNQQTNIGAVVDALEKMSQTKTGALIVIERDNALDFVTQTGDKMNIEVSQPILESIFYKNSPLHDGAAVIEKNFIIATRVILPVSDERSIPLRFGLRHRAAVGITEKTDALALVVSEETGSVSLIKNGEFVLFKHLEELKEILKNELV
ncbi:MAG TPA: TIGR00159 family protein [Flavobacteriaceae bacterium]|nr:TIGR00159 family protein [Flavobacteriaceae bacterium]